MANSKKKSHIQKKSAVVGLKDLCLSALKGPLNPRFYGYSTILKGLFVIEGQVNNLLQYIIQKLDGSLEYGVHCTREE